MTVLPHLDAGTVSVGDIFRGRSRKFTLGRVLAFSGGAFGEPGWPHRNLHTDSEKAREAGLTDIIVSGTQFEGILLAHLVHLFGQSWYDGGELEAKIVKSAYVDDVVTPVAVVRTVVDGETAITVELEVWCEKQGEEKILIGHAAARVPGKA